jgi:hypothetical protein
VIFSSAIDDSRWPESVSIERNRDRSSEISMLYPTVSAYFLLFRLGGIGSRGGEPSVEMKPVSSNFHVSKLPN